MSARIVSDIPYGSDSSFTKSDRLYFEQHPDRDWYLRSRCLDEVFVEMRAGQEPMDGDLVLVVRPIPGFAGARVRTVHRIAPTQDEIACILADARRGFGL